MACGRTPTLDAVPSVTPVMGDANGDGRVDISDGLFVERWHFAAGPRPACTAAADFVQDGVWDAGDGFSIWAHLFQGATFVPTLGECATEPLPEAPSGRMALQIGAAAEAQGDEADAIVQIVTRDLPIEAWSLPVTAEGCTITSATTSGTIAAGTEAGGRRASGYDRTGAVADGAVSAVALDYIDRVELEPSKDPYDVLALRVRADGDCQSCTVRIGAPVAGVEAVLTSNGRSYLPDPVEATFDLCD